MNPLPITKKTPTAAPQDQSMSIITNERVNIFGSESLFFRFTEDETPTSNALDNVVRKGTKIVYRIQDTCDITLYGNLFNNIFTDVEVDIRCNFNSNSYTIEHFTSNRKWWCNCY